MRDHLAYLQQTTRFISTFSSTSHIFNIDAFTLGFTKSPAKLSRATIKFFWGNTAIRNQWSVVIGQQGARIISCSNNVSAALVKSNLIADYSNASHGNTTTLEPSALAAWVISKYICNSCNFEFSFNFFLNFRALSLPVWGIAIIKLTLFAINLQTWVSRNWVAGQGFCTSEHAQNCL